ncbi:hypothetical protein ACEWY4_002017 [Coilia grayii]|uniref:Tetraspanin n=1 Tax=Coilia grayii TaxID=363190 RepID=A0ABD1KUL1_9TELE
MANASCLLRNLFITFNVLFMIVGAVLLVLAIVIDVTYTADKYNGLIGLYIFGAVTVVTAFIGAHGAMKNVKWMLVVFLVLMCVDCFSLLRLAVPLAVLHPRVGVLQEEMQSVGPLDKTSEDFQKIMNEFQSQLQCCGLVHGYLDWRGKVPESCDCTSDELLLKSCTAMDYDFENWSYYKLGIKKTRMVRIQPCGEKIVHNFLDLLLGLLFGFAALAFLGIVLSACLIAQQGSKAKALSKPSKIFSISAHPPKYSQLYEYE